MCPNWLLLHCCCTAVALLPHFCCSNAVKTDGTATDVSGEKIPEDGDAPIDAVTLLDQNFME
jgi:hypothetical protein